MYRLAFLFLFISFPVFSFPTDEVTFGISPAIVKVHVVDKIGNHDITNNINQYLNKYLKYKSKYLKLKK